MANKSYKMETNKRTNINKMKGPHSFGDWMGQRKERNAKHSAGSDCDIDWKSNSTSCLFQPGWGISAGHGFSQLKKKLGKNF